MTSRIDAATKLIELGCDFQKVLETVDEDYRSLNEKEW